MTPSARVAAAIDILDRVLAGQPAEQALITWARRNRYAGSGDRHAVRDLVFDAIRCKMSYAGLGHGLTGRGLMIGRLRAAGDDPSEIFTGEGYGPPPLTVTEAADPSPLSELDALDCPAWLAPQLRQDLGQSFEETCALLRERAPLFLRVNLRKGDLSEAREMLKRDGIEAQPHDLSATALRVKSGLRKVQRSDAYLSGLVEIQDAASQAVCDRIPVRPSDRVLDLCAGGGGKTLAPASRVAAQFFAHDVNSQRMQDLPERAKRAGISVSQIPTRELDRHAPFDVVVADVPCSGSGAWRRQAEAKWQLTADRLSELVDIQAKLLDQSLSLVGAQGTIAYVTCSVLQAENHHQILAFLERHPNCQTTEIQQFLPSDGGDGLFLALITRKDKGVAA